MRTGIQVTDPRRAALVGATTAVAVGAVVAGAVALLVVPLLARVDATLATLNSSLPVLERVGPDVDTLREDVGAIAPDVDALDRTVGEVEQGLGEVDRSVLGLRDPLATLDRSVGGVDDSVRDVGTRLDSLDAAIARLERDLGPLQHLPDVLAELRATNDGVSTIADNTAGLATALDDVVASLERVTALLGETEQHVENLDRKTGPVLVPEGP